MSHTPGPWFAWDSPRAWYVFADEGDNPSNVPVADCTGTQERSRAECEANARLMAAAPDMLDALKAALENLSECDDRKRQWACDEVEAAIAKATVAEKVA